MKLLVTVACLMSATAFHQPSRPAPALLLRESAAGADAAAPAEAADPRLTISDVPGMIQLDDITLARQSTALDALGAKWTRKTELREWEESRLTGFSEQAEIINGRMAMFFLVVGLLTEYWTGQSIPQQVITMAQILG